MSHLSVFELTSDSLILSILFQEHPDNSTLVVIWVFTINLFPFFSRFEILLKKKNWGKECCGLSGLCPFIGIQFLKGSGFRRGNSQQPQPLEKKMSFRTACGLFTFLWASEIICWRWGSAALNGQCCPFHYPEKWPAWGPSCVWPALFRQTSPAPLSALPGPLPQSPTSTSHASLCLVLCLLEFGKVRVWLDQGHTEWP